MLKWPICGAFAGPVHSFSRILLALPLSLENPAAQCPRICCAAKLQMLRSKTTNAAQQNYKRCAAKLQTLHNARSPERRGVSATLKPSHAHQETETRALRRGFTERARRFYIMKKRSRRARSPETPRRAGPQRAENRRIRPLFALIKNRDKREHFYVGIAQLAQHFYERIYR